MIERIKTKDYVIYTSSEGREAFLQALLEDYNKTNMKNEQLNNWIFFYSPYQETWKACKREDYGELFNDIENEKVLKSKKIETLVEYITKNQ